MALVAAWPHSALEAPPWGGHLEEGGMFMPDHCQSGMQVMQFVHLHQPVDCQAPHQQLQPNGWMTPGKPQQPHGQQAPQRRHQSSPTGGTPGRKKGSAASGNNGQWRESFTTSSSTSSNHTSSNRSAAPDRNARPGTPPGKSMPTEELSPSEGDFRSLKHQLQAVNLEDPAAVITVREIKNLIWPGATVEERLEAYFERFGGVKEVLVPRAAVKHVSANRRASIKGNRVRSSNVGWVVMSSASAVTEILRSSQHFVEGVTVRVEEFRRSNWDGDAKAESTARSSSSDSSTSAMRQSKEAMPQIEISPVLTAMAARPATPTWAPAGGPHTSPHHAGIALVADGSVSTIACAVPLHWIPGNMPASPLMAAGGWALAETPTQMHAPFSQVFNASDEELRQAMPEIYDD